YTLSQRPHNWCAAAQSAVDARKLLVFALSDTRADRWPRRQSWAAVPRRSCRRAPALARGTRGESDLCVGLLQADRGPIGNTRSTNCLGESTSDTCPVTLVTTARAHPSPATARRSRPPRPRA